MTKWTDKDTAKRDEISIKEVKRASHQAKDDAAKEGGWGVPEDRHAAKEAAKEQKANEKAYRW